MPKTAPSRIFISHAAADQPLVDEFVDDIVRLGCAVPSDAICYTSGPDTGVPSGSNLNTYVRDHVASVGLVIALITPTFQTRPYCIAELGAAWSRVGQLFPLCAPGTTGATMDGVLDGMIVRPMDDAGALDELHDRICAVLDQPTGAPTWGKYRAKWLRHVKALPAMSPPPAPNGLVHVNSSNGDVGAGANRWGQLFDSFVDAALYTADDSVGRDEILKAADVNTLVPGRYLYSSDLGAENWTRLCKDPAYRHHRETFEYWSSAKGRSMVDRIRAELGRDDFDYVSLGSGDGRKDAEIVTRWLETGADIFYYPYDISLPLVSRAIRTVREQAPSAATERLSVKAVLADFNQLNTISEVFRHRRSPNVVALLGNSLGNLENELTFLRNLKREMSSDDLLILEVRLQSSEDRPPELATPQAMRFDFGAMEHYLGLKFVANRMTVRQDTQLSSIPKTKTTVVGCRDVKVNYTTYESVSLIHIHEYDKTAFVDALEGDLDFTVVAEKLSDDKTFLVCVVRKKS